MTMDFNELSLITISCGEHSVCIIKRRISQVERYRFDKVSQTTMLLLLTFSPPLAIVLYSEALPTKVCNYIDACCFCEIIGIFKNLRSAVSSSVKRYLEYTLEILAHLIERIKIVGWPLLLLLLLFVTNFLFTCRSCFVQE